jgi:protein N-terminal glutamine amidohydrolase
VKHRYQPFYCEENVWWLLHELARARSYALFISNAHHAVALWRQRSAPAHQPLVWDYHVIALEVGETAMAWDLDSRLPRPVTLARYLAETFGPLPKGVVTMAPLFRIIAAEIFLTHLATDRAHMRAADGSFLKPPPPWPPPHGARVGGAARSGSASNVLRFADMSDPCLGEVVDLAGLCQRFGVDMF